MSTLNALIPLQTQGINIQAPNLLQAMMQTAQLRELEQQQQLRDVQLQELIRRRQVRQDMMAPGGLLEQAYKGLGGESIPAPNAAQPVAPSPLRPQAPAPGGAIQQGPLTPPDQPITLPGAAQPAGQDVPLPGQPVAQPVRQPQGGGADRTAQQFALYGQILAKHGEDALPYVSELLKMQKEYADQRKQDAEVGRIGAETDAKRQEMAAKAFTQTAELWDSVKAAKDDDKQSAYSLARDISSLMLPPQLASRIPEQYNPQFVDQMSRQAIAAKDRAELAIKGREAAVKEAGVGIDQAKLGLEGRKTAVQEAGVGLDRARLGLEGRKTAVQEAGVDIDLAKLNLEGQRLDKTMRKEQTGQELSLQKEYNDLTKNYRDIRDAMGRIKASGEQPSVAGDYSLIYAYVKMLDPATGVRNEESRTVASAGGLPGQAQRWLEWVKGEQLLPDNIRADFLQRSSMLYDQYQQEYGDLAQQFKEQASRQGLNPANVVRDYSSTTRRGEARILTNADIAETLKDPRNKGKTRQDIVNQARRMGYRVPGE